MSAKGGLRATVGVEDGYAYLLPEQDVVVALLTNLEDLPAPARLEIARQLAGIVAPP